PRLSSAFRSAFTSATRASALTRVDRAERGAHVRGLVGVELLERRRQVLDDVADLELYLVDEAGAVRAVPLELLERPPLADPLDPRADGANLGTLRGVRRVAGQQPGLALADVHSPYPAVDHDVDVDVALELVEPLLVGVHVEVGPGVGPADDLHD